MHGHLNVKSENLLMLFAPTKHTLPTTQKFCYVFVNSPLSTHLIRLHIVTFFSLQTNSGTPYRALGTVTASLDSLIGRQLRLLNLLAPEFFLILAHLYIKCE